MTKIFLQYLHLKAGLLKSKMQSIGYKVKKHNLCKQVVKKLQYGKSITEKKSLAIIRVTYRTAS